LIHVKSDRVMLETLPLGAQSITALNFVPGLGEIAGDAAGAIYQNDGSGWTMLDTSKVAFIGPITALVPYETGFIAAGDGGDLTEYVPGASFCPRIHAASQTVFRIIPFGSDLVLAEFWDNISPIGPILTSLKRKP
jgi:hypothetical protein